MTAPALLPAVAILLGVVAGANDIGHGCRGSGTLMAALAALSVLLGGWTALILRRARLAVALALVATSLAGGGLAARAEREAMESPLGGLFERHAAVTVEAGPTSVRNADRAWATEVCGRLRQDARGGVGGGVVLEIDVTSADEGAGRRATRGGVLISVGGALAASAAPEWRAGRAVRLPVLLREANRYWNPGVPDHRLALKRRGVALVGSAKSAALVEVTAPGSWWSEAAAAARAWVRREIASNVGRWSTRSSAIVTAVLAGDRAGLAPEVEQRLQEAGTYHVIAISGGNIAILAGLMMLCLSAAGAGRRGARLVTIAALAAYAGFVGDQPSVARATLMAVLYLSAGLVDLRSSALNGVGVAAVVALAVAPLSVFEAGFALTFVATIGIIVLTLRFGARLPHRQPWRALAALLAASVAAETALLPIAAAAFSRVTFAGLILNFLAIPLMTVVQTAGLATLALAWWPWAAGSMGAVAHLAADLLVGSAGLVTLAPWLSVRVPPPAAWVVAAYYVALACVIAPAGWARWLPARAGASQVGGMCMATLLATWMLWSPAPLAARADGRLRVTWLDVGQGDAALVRFPLGGTLLVDTGGPRSAGNSDFGARIVSPALWALGLRRLDELAITHGDPDHAGGAGAVDRDFRPRSLWEGIVVPGDAVLEALRAGQRAREGRSLRLRAGQRIQRGGVVIEVLHPPEPEWERRQVRNDDSLVVDIRLGDVSMLLTGDIGASVEREIASRLRPAAIRVVKVPHHGSASSSSEAFLRAARPALAVLSAGRGGWLGRGVLERYRRLGVPLVRTDEDGAITVSTDGHTVVVVTHSGRRITVEGPPAEGLAGPPTQND